MIDETFIDRFRRGCEIDLKNWERLLMSDEIKLGDSMDFPFERIPEIQKPLLVKLDGFDGLWRVHYPSSVVVTKVSASIES